MISIYPIGSSDPGHRIRFSAGQPVPEGYTTLQPPPAEPDHTVEWDGAAWAQMPIPEPEPEAPETPEQYVERCRLAIVAHLDAVVRERDYDSMLSCVSYAGSVNEQWAAEAAAAIAWRDAVWTYAHALLDDPPDPLPTPEELIADPAFPTIAWPAAAVE